uniref:hypothetical protein n=1 Tax=Ilumatobacter nonamiensis TaxID=467093 RepID=UPI00058BA608
EYWFRRGWTSVDGVELSGDTADEIVYYDARSGFTRFMNPNHRGSGRLLAQYSFRPGWTSVTGVQLDGGADELLYYGT